ncbi:MAG: undecaprenyl-diphosphate phosphatase [Parvibaculum sp.]
MSLEQIILLALIQGITEFLPISSSGHLSLVDELTGWADQGILMDIAVHTGTLGAVLLYFRRDVWAMTLGGLQLFSGQLTNDGKLALYLVVATIPVIIFGYTLLKSGYADQLRVIEVVAWANLVFAVILWIADRVGLTLRRLDHMSWGAAILIGLSQVLALIPGASRAGTTITAARFLGFERADAARFSMLLSIPTILGATIASLLEVYERGDMALGIDMGVAALLTFGTALLAIHLFLKMMTQMTLLPFVIYRLALGTLLLVWIYA